MIDIDPSTLSLKDTYRLLIGAIVPRPIAFVSTRGRDGSLNVAPFSFFSGASSKPPCLMFACAASPTKTKKDTLQNIEETKEFVVNSANEWMIKQVVQAAADYPYGVNEIAEVGLTSLESTVVKAPRIKESAVQFECTLHKLVPLGDGGLGSSTVVIGEIVSIHVQEDCYKDGKILLEPFRPVGRLGGISYGTIGDVQSIPVMPVAETRTKEEKSR